MYYLSRRICAHFPQWNKTSLTEFDCLEFLETNSIRFERAPLCARGYYGKVTTSNAKSRDCIVVDDSLRGTEFLKVLLHEIGHAILHEPFGDPSTLYYRKRNSIESIQDFEADFFAIVALIPFARLFSRADTDVGELELELLQARLLIFETHRL